MPYPPALLDTLAGRPTILPNANAAHALRQAYSDRQRSSSIAAWQPPDVFSWDQFLESLWSEAIVNGSETRLLLSPAQEHALWLDVLALKPPPSALASPDALANLAGSAWSLVHAYEAHPRLRLTALSHDTRTFADWADLFRRECVRHQYLTRAELASALTEHLTHRTLTVPSELLLLGFLEHTPAAQRLLSALRDAGCVIDEQHLSNSNTAAHQIITPDETTELQAAAARARTLLEENPQSHIAVILPDTSEAPALDSVFRELLAPELELVTADTSSTPWEMPDAGPLSTQSLVATALDLLRLTTGPLELPKISALLLSPYLNSPEARLQAARFDTAVVRTTMLLRPEFELNTLHRLTQATPSAPSWIANIHTLLTPSPLEGQRTFADWAGLTRSILQTAGWPSSRTLNPLEQQAQEAFDAALDTISTLDFRGRRVPFTTFLTRLIRQCAEPFHPASTNAPIQVLSINAALAQSFDHLILLRSTDANYPAKERAHPLLSFALQADTDMPGAKPERAAERAQSTLRSLLQNSTSTTFTFARQTASGEQRFSPLLTSLASPQSLDPATPHSEPPIALEALQEPSLPPLPAAEVIGGARVLKLQAACGFQAFAAIRLRSEEPRSITAGFDALESGNFLHKTMERFWRAVKTQKNLRNMSHDERLQLLTDCINLSIPARLIADTDWERSYLSLQKDRLRRVLNTWLTKELDRSPFTVLDSEKPAQIPIGPLSLSVRIDRIDQLEDGGFVFVDYKTGYSVDPRQWDGDRPDDPQLPLYSLLMQPEELKGLAFARIRAGEEMKWTGMQSEENILPIPRGSVTDIDSAIEEWRSILTTLATDFAAGAATVNPKDVNLNCTHCVERLICRINPEAFLAPSADEATDEGAQ